MDKIKVLERQIADLRVKIRRVDNFSKQLEYNIFINDLQNEKRLLQEILLN